ncbi:MAG: type II toxin-antitoxin system HicB family antitoxin [Methylovulum sp.]|nr:type II toxin-antitoxin system HicB family antitoxin [Methylovulum sp.]
MRALFAACSHVEGVTLFDYPVVLNEQAEGGFVVTFPDIPEAITQGNSVDEALESALSFYVDDRKALPEPSVLPNLPTVRPSTLESIKLGVYREMLAQGIRKADLARRLGWKPPQVDRLFDLNHASRLDQLEAAAKALGKHIDATLA